MQKPHLRPAETIEPAPGTTIRQGSTHVGNHILRRVIKFKPRQVVALIWLAVAQFARPALSDQEEVNPLIV